MQVPMSLIIDDGSPVNMRFWHTPNEKHAMLISNRLASGFADLCKEHGVRGKFSLMPMPAGMGRIDQSLTYVPHRDLEEFVRIVRRRIAPMFDISPELLTHLAAYDIKGKKYLHLWEDEWVARAGVAEITDYIAFGLRLLKEAGFAPAGVTSPWYCGHTNEKAYAEGIARAYWRVSRQKTAWYFLHCLGNHEPQWPWVSWRDRKLGLSCVSVAATTPDVFGATMCASGARSARAAARRGVDRLLTARGQGRIRRLVDENYPVTILTHWQSLFSNGSMAGLWGLELLLQRLKRTFGDSVAWVRLSELAGKARPQPPAKLYRAWPA